MPGPNAYLEQLCDELRAGCSVIAAVPSSLAHPSLLSALREQLRDAQFMCTFVNGAEVARSPTPARTFAALAEIEAKESFRKLGSSSQELGRAIVVHSVDVDAGKVWREAAAEFAAGSHQLEQDSRTPLCIIWSGASASELPKKNVTLQVVEWEGVSDRLDLTLWASLCAGGLRSLERQVRTSTAVELSGGDPWLAQELVDCPPLGSEVLTALTEYAARRGWTVSTELSLRLGTQLKFEGAIVTHSAMLAITGKHDELDRRCWRAQLRVLFPHLEEERLRLVRAHAKKVAFPVKTAFGFVSKPDELELAHLLHHLRHQVPGGVANQMDDMVCARNALAHLEPIPEAVLRRMLG